MSDILDNVDKWVTEYTTGNSDYPTGYGHIIQETSHDWQEYLDEWIDNDSTGYADILIEAYEAGEIDFDLSDGEVGEFDHDEFITNVLSKPTADSVKEWVFDHIEGDFDCEPEYAPSEYGRYSGPGCCLASFDIGEHEEQNAISRFPELQNLHDKGILDDVLDDVRSDAYVSRRLSRIKNVGRETYDPYGSDYPDIMTYHQPGGQWHFVVPVERMKELIREAVVDLADNAE